MQTSTSRVIQEGIGSVTSFAPTDIELRQSDSHGVPRVIVQTHGHSDLNTCLKECIHTRYQLLSEADLEGPDVMLVGVCNQLLGSLALMIHGPKPWVVRDYSRLVVVSGRNLRATHM